LNQRSLVELRDVADPVWPELRAWLAAAKNRVEVVPIERAAGEAALERAQVTARSTMGALALETGGLVIDGGWLRLYGAASARVPGGLAGWNGFGEPALANPAPHGFCLVAHDAVGGFFAVDGGAFSQKPGHVFYFAPDTLEWEDLGRGHTDFVRWAIDGDLARFYENARWDGWQDAVAALAPERGFSIYPPLWTVEGKTGPVSRRPVPMTELWALQVEFRRQLANGS
jgi:hypothetical protein